MSLRLMKEKKQTRPGTAVPLQSEDNYWSVPFPLPPGVMPH